MEVIKGERRDKQIQNSDNNRRIEMLNNVNTKRVINDFFQLNANI